MDKFEITCETFTTRRHNERIVALHFQPHFLLRTANLQDRDKALAFLERVSADQSIRALVVVGSPDAKGRQEFMDFFRQFGTSGMDPALVHRMYNVISQLVLRLAEMNKFVVYINSGRVLASFLNIGLACDYRILAEDALIQNPCVDVGLIAKGGGAYFIPKLIGRAKTYEIMLSKKDVSAHEARELGLVNEVVPFANLESAAFERAEEFSQKPLSSVAALKALLNFSYQDLQRYLEHENEVLLRSFSLGNIFGKAG